MQLLVFMLLILIGTVVSFYFSIHLIDWAFKEYLHGNTFFSGEKIAYSLENKTDIKTTDFFFNWSVDLFKKTPQETRYWFNPTLSLTIPCIFFGILFAFIFSSVLNTQFGYIKQKIERVISGILDKICLQRFGNHSEIEVNQIVEEIKNADLRDFHDFENQWQMKEDDLSMLRNAILWNESNFFKRLININHGTQIYLKNYFIQKYENNILGLVYVGAAVLILIIGLRGLKFIPSTEPSLVIFALGLEFSLLISYAFTLMFGKVESSDSHVQNKSNNDFSNILLSDDFGTGKEAEHLLRLFINSDYNLKEKK